MRLYTVTSPKLLSRNMQDLSTCSQAGSPASHLVLPGSRKAQPTLATSGQSSLELFAKSDRAGSWAKTFAALLIGRGDWYSTRCNLTWKLKVTKSSRSYFQLAPSTPRTGEIGSGLLPTAQMLPTPMAKDYRATHADNSDAFLKRTLHSRGVPLPEHLQRLRGGLGGQLSPLFVMEMMGFPANWTLLPFLVRPVSPHTPEPLPAGATRV